MTYGEDLWIEGFKKWLEENPGKTINDIRNSIDLLISQNKKKRNLKK